MRAKNILKCREGAPTLRDIGGNQGALTSKGKPLDKRHHSSRLLEGQNTANPSDDLKKEKKVEGFVRAGVWGEERTVNHFLGKQG